MVHACKGIELSIWTFVLTIFLEYLSLDTVKKLLDQKGGPTLYKAGVMANLRNHFVIGWTMYTGSAVLFCRQDGELDIKERICCVTTILFVHSVAFYAAHRTFHTYPNLYKHHRFHHKFNTFVPPMAANAVSTVEYIFAYILPFSVAMPFCHPDPVSLRISVATVSVTNLLIHTPGLQEMSDHFVPEWLVSTSDHLEHHRKLNTKYAAPTFNIDYFVKKFERWLRGEDSSYSPPPSTNSSSSQYQPAKPFKSTPLSPSRLRSSPS